MSIHFYTLVFRRDVLWYGAVRPPVASSLRPFVCLPIIICQSVRKHYTQYWKTKKQKQKRTTTDKQTPPNNKQQEQEREQQQQQQQEQQQVSRIFFYI